MSEANRKYNSNDMSEREKPGDGTSSELERMTKDSNDKPIELSDLTGPMNLEKLELSKTAFYAKDSNGNPIELSDLTGPMNLEKLELSKTASYAKLSDLPNNAKLAYLDLINKQLPLSYSLLSPLFGRSYLGNRQTSPPNNIEPELLNPRHQEPRYHQKKMSI